MMVRMTYCMIQWKLKPCRIFQRKTNNKYWWSFDYRSKDLEASSYKDKNNKVVSRRSKILQETLNWKVLKTWFKCAKPTGYYKRFVFSAFFPQEVIYRIEASTNKVIRSILEKYDERFYYFRFVYETGFIGTLYLRPTWSLNLNDVQIMWSHESAHYTFHAAIQQIDLISFSSLLSLVTNSGIF